jgi:hypothetical protein
VSNPEADEDILFEEVCSFISVQRSANRNHLTAETSLYHDLGTDGIDADNLLRAFSEMFRVNMANFKYDRHFGPERGVNLFALFLYLCLKLFPRNKLLLEVKDTLADKKAPLKICDLVRAARSGQWPADLDERPLE